MQAVPTANCVLETGEPPPAPVAARPLLLVREALEPSGSQPKLLDRLRLALRSRHYSRSTEKTYLMWVRRFIFFHEVRHPAGLRNNFSVISGTVVAQNPPPFWLFGFRKH